MKKNKMLRQILENYMKQLGLDDLKIHLRTRKLKTKAASCNLDKNIIYINKYLLTNNEVDEKIISYIILHELLHIKLKTTIHTLEFNEMLQKYFNKEELEAIHKTIVKKLTELNNINKDIL